MAILTYLVPLLALALAWPARWLQTRGRDDAAVGRDRLRSSLAGFAMALSLVAAVYALVDESLVARPGVGLLLLAQAAAAGLLGSFPPHMGWSQARCTFTLATGLVWLAFAFVLVMAASMASSCGCVATGPIYVPPPLLGVIDTRILVDIDAIAVPVLLLAASVLRAPRLVPVGSLRFTDGAGATEDDPTREG